METKEISTEKRNKRGSRTNEHLSELLMKGQRTSGIRTAGPQSYSSRRNEMSMVEGERSEREREAEKIRHVKLSQTFRSFENHVVGPSSDFRCQFDSLLHR